MKTSNVVNDELAIVAEGAGTDGQPRLRQNFAETAYFSALLRSDKEGRVQLDFKLPDTQTEYVLKVYSFAPDFKEELLEDHDFRVFAPLSVELSLPRYLRWGDRLEGLARCRMRSSRPRPSVQPSRRVRRSYLWRSCRCPVVRQAPCPSSWRQSALMATR